MKSDAAYYWSAAAPNENRNFAVRRANNSSLSQLRHVFTDTHWGELIWGVPRTHTKLN